MTFEEWWEDFVAEHDDWKYADSEALRRAAFQAGVASRDAEVAQWQKIIDEEAKDSALVIIERDQLCAQINVLREALSKMHDTYFKTDEDEELCKRALATTPEQSLAEYRNKVIEDCAVLCEKSDRYRGAYFAEKLRAMKEQP